MNKNLFLFFLLSSILLNSSSSFGQYIISGNASSSGNNCYQLTPNSTYQVGSVWNASLISLNDPFDFVFNVYLGADDGGADGICFGLQPLNTNVGTTGNGMGLGGISPSLGVYIDTYENGVDGDPTYDHISLNSNGDSNHSSANNLAGPVQANATNANIEDNGNHQIRIQWDPSTQTMNVLFDGVPRFTYTGDIINTIFGGNPNVYWGFTGSTGALTNQQSFCVINVTNFTYTNNCYTIPVHFTDLSIGSAINLWSWDFGDSSPILSGNGPSFQNPNHLFPASGSYTVTLTISNAIGATGTATYIVNVMAPPPISASVSSGICSGQSINLTGTNGPNIITSPTFTNTVSNIPIIDNGVLASWTGSNFGVFATSTIPVSGLTPGWTFNSVTLNLSHPFDSDLIVYLFNPCGNSIQLINSVGGSGDNFTNTIFNSSATNPLIAGIAPFSGVFIPSGGAAAFTTFINSSQACAGANGNWYIRVGDHGSGDAGSIINWSLRFNNSATPSFSWSPTTAMTNPNSLTPTVSPTVTTTYSLTSTNAVGCISTATTTLIVNTTSTVTANSATICTGGVAHITANGATSYNWSTGVSSTGITTADVAPAATTTYTVASAGTCSTPATFTVTVAPTINVTVTSVTICNGTTANLIASGASSYNWSAGAATTGLATADASPTITTTYSVTGLSGTCSGVGTGTVTVNPIPIVTCPSTTACSGQTATLTANGATTYSWSSGATALAANTAIVAPLTNTTFTVSGNTLGCIGNTTVTVTTSPTPTVTVNSETICLGATALITANGAIGYSWSNGVSTVGLVSANVSPLTTSTYSVTGTSNGCSSTITYTVTIAGSLPITTTSSTICAGDAGSISAFGATDYVWSTGATNATITNSPSVTTTYSVVGTSNFCSGTGTATITVNPIPFVNVSNVSICNGQTATLMPTGAATYTWSNGVTASVANNFIANPTSTTTYTVNGNSLGCVGTNTVDVTVIPNPTVTISNITMCYGTTALLTANGAATYTWSAGATSIGLTSANIAPLISTNYTVTGSTDGCSSSALATATVSSAIPLTVSSSTICFGDVANLLANGANTYIWSAGANSPGSNAATANPNTSTTYTVTGIVGNCQTSATTTVTVNSLPIVVITPVTVCSGQNATLTATGASDFVWSNGATSNPLIVTPAATVTYSATGTTLGCSSTSTVEVTVNSSVAISVSSASICSGATALLTASGASTYNWSSGATPVAIDQAEVNPTSTASYTVTGNTLGCSGTSISNVTVHPLPISNFTSPDFVAVSNPTVAFTDLSVNASSWAWDFGDNAAIGTNTSNLQNPAHTYADTGKYCIKLVTNNSYCTNSITHCIVIEPEFMLFVPSAFTPDLNGTNDEFYPKGQYIKTYDMQIYDRWGNMVFSSDAITKHWDGKANGGSEPVQNDVYVYVIDVVDIAEVKHKLIGNVTVIK